jgi:hypothetical protein
MPLTAPGFVGPTTTSSLVALYQSVSAYFQALSVNAAVYLGLKERDRWDTSRVVIIDGEFDGSNTPKPRAAGRFRAPWQKQSTNPRELVGWERPVTLSIRGVDPTQPDSEAAQVQATEALIELTVQAVHNATAIDAVTGATVAIGQANIDWSEGRTVWVDAGSATQQTWGKEFLVGFTYKCVFFDAALQVVTPTPALGKNLLSTPQSGIHASIATAKGSSAVVKGLGFCTPAMADGSHSLQLSGAATSANNGTFPIAFFLSPTSLVIANAAAVADANNGSISWAVVPSP